MNGSRSDGRWAPLSEIVIAAVLLVPTFALSVHVFRANEQALTEIESLLAAVGLAPLIYLISGQAQLARWRGPIWAILPVFPAIIATLPTYMGITTPSEATVVALFCAVLIDLAMKFGKLTPPWWLWLRLPFTIAVPVAPFVAFFLR